jgi:hypothetical protein
MDFPYIYIVFYGRVAHQAFGFHYRNPKGGLSITNVDELY